MRRTAAADLNAASHTELMNRGHAARRAGRPEEALELYRQALAQEPASAEANSVCGLMLLHLGRAGEAGPLLERAVEIAPTHAALRLNLAEWHRHEGRFDQAEAIAAAVAADQPQLWQAWEKLGELKARSGRFAEAESDFARAVALRPRDPSLLYKRARACFDAGRIDESLRILGEAAPLAPGHPAILRLHADALESRAAWPALERVALEWTHAHPEAAPAWRSLAIAQWQLGHPRRALPSYRAFLDRGGRNAETLATFGTICLHALDLEQAATALDESEALDPKNAAMLSARAMLHMWNGRYDQAEACCRRSLALNPADATAWRTLTELMNGRLSDDELATLRALAERGDASLQIRISALFALGDCHDAADRIDEAFACYERANHLAVRRAEAEGLMYDPALTARQTQELIAMFDSVPEPAGPRPDDQPIFIVGMPRSGTTLLESVFGAHSQVVAGGERLGIRMILPEFLAFVRAGRVIPAEQWQQWRAVYREEMPRPEGVVTVTDKNPWNFDAIGLILGLFPGAHVIHMRRNPVETGFSIFRHEFSKHLRFTHRLEDIGHFYGEYARVMAHWERVAGERIKTVQYEDFVRQFDVAAPALLAACGLQWEAACGEFWKSRHAVSTISAMQVRRPLGKAAARARDYAAQLQPLVAALRQAEVQLETGAPVRSPSQ